MRTTSKSHFNGQYQWRQQIQNCVAPQKKKNTVSNQFTLRTKITANLKLVKPTKVKLLSLARITNFFETKNVVVQQITNIRYNSINKTILAKPRNWLHNQIPKL